MVQRRYRTSRFRKVYVRTAHGTKLRVKKREKAVKQRCAICGAVIKLGKGKGAKTRTGKSRAFTGKLCHSCAERVLRYKARVELTGDIESVPIIYRPYI